MCKLVVSCTEETGGKNCSLEKKMWLDMHEMMTRYARDEMMRWCRYARDDEMGSICTRRDDEMVKLTHANKTNVICGCIKIRPAAAAYPTPPAPAGAASSGRRCRLADGAAGWHATIPQNTGVSVNHHALAHCTQNTSISRNSHALAHCGYLV